MTRAWRALVLAAVLVQAAACGSLGPGQPGYPFNVGGVYTGRLAVVGETMFDAELDLATALGGSVRGRFRVRQPMEIDGRVEGTVIDDLLRLTVTYPSATNDDCLGRIEGILTVEPGGEVIEGPATITDCGNALAGRMSFRR